MQNTTSTGCNMRHESRIKPSKVGPSPVILLSNGSVNTSKLPHLTNLIPSFMYLMMQWQSCDASLSILGVSSHLVYTVLDYQYVLCIMSCKAISKLTPEERRNFKEYLKIHWVFDSKCPCEVISEAIAWAFPGITESEIKSLPSGPLPSMQARWVSTTQVTQTLCWARCPSYAGSLSLPYWDLANNLHILDPHTIQGNLLLSINFLHSRLSDYAESGDEKSKK